MADNDKGNYNFNLGEFNWDVTADNTSKGKTEASLKQLVGLPFNENGEFEKAYYYDTYNMNNFASVDMGFGFRKAYIFITCPDCKLPFNNETGKLESKSNARALYNFINSSPDNIKLAEYLAFSKKNNINPWFFPLMNSLKGISNFPAFNMKTSRSSANMRNNYIEMAVDTKESLSDNSVTLTFEDDRYGTVSKIIYMWIEYMDNLRLGLIDHDYNFTEGIKYSTGAGSNNVISASSNTSYDYDIIDYMCSIFIFITDETGERIIFPFKLTGCFPKGKAYDFINIAKPVIKDKNDISVTFAVSIPEDMKTEIYGDFNNVGWLTSSVQSDIIDTGDSKSSVSFKVEALNERIKTRNGDDKVAATVDRYNYTDSRYPNRFTVTEMTKGMGDFKLIRWNDKSTTDFLKVKTK